MEALPCGEAAKLVRRELVEKPACADACRSAAPCGRRSAIMVRGRRSRKAFDNIVPRARPLQPGNRESRQLSQIFESYSTGFFDHSCR